MLKEKYELVKEHVRENKELYILGGICFAGFTVLIMRGRYSGLQRGPEDTTAELLRGSDTTVSADIRSFNFFSKNDNHIVQVIEREGRGHPGYLIDKIGTDERFRSQHELAKKLGVSDSVVSGHLQGKIPDILGDQYERVGGYYPI